MAKPVIIKSGKHEKHAAPAYQKHPPKITDTHTAGGNTIVEGKVQYGNKFIPASTADILTQPPVSEEPTLVQSIKTPPKQTGNLHDFYHDIELGYVASPDALPPTDEAPTVQIALQNPKALEPTLVIQKPNWKKIFQKSDQDKVPAFIKPYIMVALTLVMISVMVIDRITYWNQSAKQNTAQLQYQVFKTHPIQNVTKTLEEAGVNTALLPQNPALNKPSNLNISMKYYVTKNKTIFNTYCKTPVSIIEIGHLIGEHLTMFQKNNTYIIYSKELGYLTFFHARDKQIYVDSSKSQPRNNDALYICLKK